MSLSSMSLTGRTNNNDVLLLRQVKTDALGRMDPSHLKRAIEDARKQHQIPFFVNATCGTTVFGAFDPLREIAAICQAEGLWLHVDVRTKDTVNEISYHMRRSDQRIVSGLLRRYLAALGQIPASATRHRIVRNHRGISAPSRDESWKKYHESSTVQRST